MRFFCLIPGRLLRLFLFPAISFQITSWAFLCDLLVPLNSNITVMCWSAIPMVTELQAVAFIAVHILYIVLIYKKTTIFIKTGREFIVSHSFIFSTAALYTSVTACCITTTSYLVYMNKVSHTKGVETITTFYFSKLVQMRHQLMLGSQNLRNKKMSSSLDFRMVLLPFYSDFDVLEVSRFLDALQKNIATDEDKFTILGKRDNKLSVYMLQLCVEYLLVLPLPFWIRKAQ